VTGFDPRKETIATFLGLYKEACRLPPLLVKATDSDGWAEAQEERINAELAIMAMDPTCPKED
jgi:hypothetical protein